MTKPRWFFDPAPPSGARRGGLANVQVFDPTLDSFAREVLQNARDQRLGDACVSVKFTLSEITGPALDDFLTAIRWEVLAEHIEGAADPDLVTIGPRLLEGLAEVETHGRLRLLCVDDTGTRGLVGGEDDDSNFAALCRHELITAADRRQSGGSFGLGKSVLWRFSSLATVLFHSRVSGDGRSRFIGRAVLPGHDAEGGSWEGSGWFGAPEEERGRAVSVWGEQAAELAAVAGLGRDGSGTGTSILVVGFDEPVRDVEREIEEICEDLVDSATRWFWPALLDGDISILVEGWRDDVREFTRHAQPSNAEVAPFIHAREDSPEVSEVIENPGEVALREIRVRAPAQRPERFESPRQAVEAPATLRIRLAESGEDSYRNTVALQRGTGMVVAYRPVKTRTGADVAFHAVLLAGRANGDTEADQALEEFLRAAEPPAHAEWTHTTERIRAEYASGFRTSILDLFGQIEAAVRDLTREEVVESDEGPDALKRLFPMPGVGVPAREETHRLADARAELQHEHWVFGGRYIRKPREASERERDWRFQIALFLDQEGSGAGSARGDRVAIGELEVEEPARVCEPNADGTVDVVVPAGTDRVRFWGLSDPVSALPPGGLRRVRLRMDLRTLRAEVAL